MPSHSRRFTSAPIAISARRESHFDPVSIFCRSPFLDKRSPTMPTVLAVSGSPSPRSRTVIAVNGTLSLLASEGHTTSHLAVRELPASDLLAGVRDTPAVWEATDA